MKLTAQTEDRVFIALALLCALAVGGIGGIGDEDGGDVTTLLRPRLRYSQPLLSWLMRLMVLRGSMGPLTLGGKAPALPWYLADGGSAADCVAAYQFKGAASQAASYINLVNPGTHDLALGVAPTWASATGLTFNGTTQWMNTGVIATATYSIIVRYSGEASAGANYLFGAFKSSPLAIYGVLCHTGAKAAYWNGTGFGAGTTNVASSGVLAIAYKNGYLNGVLDGTTPGDANTGLAIYLGGLNNDGSINHAINVNALAMAIYKVDKSAGIAVLTTAINLI